VRKVYEVEQAPSGGGQITIETADLINGSLIDANYPDGTEGIGTAKICGYLEKSQAWVVRITPSSGAIFHTTVPYDVEKPLVRDELLQTELQDWKARYGVKDVYDLSTH
jgi:hypothetical protein